MEASVAIDTTRVDHHWMTVSFSAKGVCDIEVELRLPGALPSSPQTGHSDNSSAEQ